MPRTGEPRPAPDVEQAFELAGHFLGTRPRSRWEVEERLRRAGATEPVITAALARLTRSGFVDDTAFARWWIEQRDTHAPRGRMALEAELRAKRVPQAVIEGMRVEHREDGGLSEGDRAEAALDRHLHGRPLPDDPKALQRLGMYLVRRGFDPATARAVLRRRGSGV